MKKSLFIITAFLGLFFTACKKNEEGTGKLYGNWKLKETLADPGDGSGRYIMVKEDKYLKMSPSGKITGDALPGLSDFKIVDSVRIEVYSKNTNQNSIFYYTVTGNTLTLNPPCTEACGLKFIRY
ncbi:hypothetical protein [Pedobacter nyackensis]|uniref:hypothetical protein n=1 Tax=Pedobacter nyackensis TaxID=475255 RepID=UPI00292F8A0C|nr:hypothetical protein [Pedobacter nyackensis]